MHYRVKHPWGVLFLLLTFILSLSAASKNSYTIVGAFSGDGTRYTTDEFNNTSYTPYTLTGMNFGVGMIERDGHRLEGTTRFIDTKDEVGRHTVLLGASIDYLLTPFTGRNSLFTPYISMGLGGDIFLSSHMVSAETNSTADGISFTASVGTFVKLSKKFEINVAYRSMATLWDRTRNELNETFDITEAMKSIYIGLIFRN